MKSSREMAIASQAQSRKRSEPTSDTDSDFNSSHSDFEKTTKASSRATKKARISTTSNTPNSKFSKAIYSTTASPLNIKLPKAMVCPSGVSAFTKPRWKAIAETDEFWAYIKSMIPAHNWRQRLPIEIKTDLNAKAAEARSAGVRSRVRVANAKKGGPVSLGLEARGGVVDVKDLHAEDGEEFGEGMEGESSATTLGRDGSGVKGVGEYAGREKTTTMLDGQAATSGFGKAPSPGTLTRLEEQRRIWDEIEAAKAKRD